MNTWTQHQSIILSWHSLLVFTAVLRQLSFFILFCLPLSLLCYLPHCLLIHRAELQVLDYNLTWPCPGFYVWNIQMVLVKKTACLWLTLLSLCLEWTVLSERQLTTGQPVQQCVWKWQTVPLWSTCILLCLQRAESIVTETVHFWPNCPPLCLEHTKTIVRKTFHFWPKYPLCVWNILKALSGRQCTSGQTVHLCVWNRQTDSTGYKHRLHVANLSISVRLISQGCFQTFLPAGCHCTNCIILLYHTHTWT